MIKPSNPTPVLPFSSIFRDPLSPRRDATVFVFARAPACVYPSMVTALMMFGSANAGAIVQTPVPTTQPGSVAAGIANTIVSRPAVPAPHSPARAPDAVSVFAAVIASRSVHLPSLAAVSAALLTVIVAARAAAGARSSAAQAAKVKPKCGRWDDFTSTTRRGTFMCSSPVVRLPFAD
jgi:hypothetical protein